MNYKIAANIVTYNGLEHLKNIVPAVKKQTYKVDKIIVVVNGSNDGSKDYLSTIPGIHVIEQENLGSSGGQFIGIKHAFLEGYDYIWCLDQDIIPETDALEKLIKSKYFDSSDLGFLSSTMFKDDQIAYTNIPELEKPDKILEAIVNAEPIPVLTATFGSLLIPSKVVSKIGLPIKEFFIYGDDSEYTLRMITHNLKGYMVLESKCVHNQENSFDNPFIRLDASSPKFRLGLRNVVYVIIMRNKITHNSRFRGLLSAFVYLLKIEKERRKGKNFSFKFYLNGILSFIKGVLYKPVIEKPY